MRGILWRWLFSMGLIFWIALCCTDYYRKNIEKHPEYLERKHLEDELQKATLLLRQRKVPPALTFWKTLSMLLSISALIYIKRSSTLKKSSTTSLVLPYLKDEENNKVFKAVSFPTKINYQICPDAYSEESRKTLSTKSNTPMSYGVVGVEIVQKKLENLERSVASLKRRHCASSATSFSSSSGIVSGSPEFQKFLSNCQNINTPTSSSMEVSIDSSQLSHGTKVPGSGLVSTSASSENLMQQKESPVSIKRSVKLDVIQEAAENTSTTHDSSWSTISVDNCSSAITDILQVKESFSKSSKVSEESTKSVLSLQSEDSMFSKDGSRVPGSTLVSSGMSSLCSSHTLMSNSSHVFGALTVDSDGYLNYVEDVLNSLD